MNKDSKTLTKIFNMADELGLYCSMVKLKGEVSSIYIGEHTFFNSDCINDSIHDADGRRYTYKDLKKYVHSYKGEKSND